MIYIDDIGPTPEQLAWWTNATPAERRAFALSGPVQIYPCLVRVAATDTLEDRFMPAVHAWRITPETFATPEEALAAGEAVQRQARDWASTEGVELPTLDLDSLNLHGVSVAEYDSPEGQADAFFAEATAALTGRLGKSDA